MGFFKNNSKSDKTKYEAGGVKNVLFLYLIIIFQVCLLAMNVLKPDILYHNEIQNNILIVICSFILKCHNYKVQGKLFLIKDFEKPLYSKVGKGVTWGSTYEPARDLKLYIFFIFTQNDLNKLTRKSIEFYFGVFWTSMDFTLVSFFLYLYTSTIHEIDSAL